MSTTLSRANLTRTAPGVASLRAQARTPLHFPNPCLLRRRRRSRSDWRARWQRPCTTSPGSRASRSRRYPTSSTTTRTSGPPPGSARPFCDRPTRLPAEPLRSRTPFRPHRCDRARDSELRQNYFAELADAVIQAAERRNVEFSSIRPAPLGKEGRGPLRAPPALDRRAAVQPGAPRSGGRGTARGRLPARAPGRTDLQWADRPRDHAQRRRGTSPPPSISSTSAGRGSRSSAPTPHPEDTRSANLRIQGYREALEAAGLPYRPELVRVAASVASREWRGCDARTPRRGCSVRRGLHLQ